MAVGIVMAVIGVIVVVALLSRQQSRRKKEAIADLAREREALKPPDILELVNEEIKDAAIGNLPGAEGVDPTVLLKVWKRDGGGCPKGQGSFVVSDGTTPEEATEDTLKFKCGDRPAE